MDWATHDHKPPRRPDPAEPERVATMFRVIGASGRAIRGASYRVLAGIELRLAYEDNEYSILQTKLFRGEHDEALAATAADWRAAFGRVGSFKQLTILD